MQAMDKSPTTTWISREAAGAIAPGITPSFLDYLQRESRYSSTLTAPPCSKLSDGEVLYDELLFRRWLESTVAHEWLHGHFGAHRAPPSDDRYYTYQDADLATLRQRTYVNESAILELVPTLPLWRLRDLRFRAVGPRFLKPSRRTVVYIAEEALDWADGVADFSDPFGDGIAAPREPYTPPIRIRDQVGSRFQS